MTTDEKTDKTTRGARGKGTAIVTRGRVTGGLALIFAFGAAVVSGWVWYTLDQQGLYSSQAGPRLQALEEHNRNLQATVTELEAQLSLQRDSQTALKATVDKVHQEFGRGRGDWMLAEVESLLVIANHRLQLAHDGRLAALALRAADDQLKRIGDPGLLGVRQQLAREIGALGTLEQLDVPGLALTLAEAAARVESLPLANAPQPPPAGEEGQKPGMWRQMWRDFLGVIRVRSTAEKARPLVLPEQQYYLRENLRLALLGAQLALVHGDAPTFARNAGLARQWLAQYYDTGAAPVKALQAELERMGRLGLGGPLPDISGSLKALRARGGRAAP